jgi:hypothetical protein
MVPQLNLKILEKYLIQFGNCDLLTKEKIAKFLAKRGKKTTIYAA